MLPARRMPAEWEPHRATWIAWPHEESDFPGKLAAVQWVYPEIVRVLATAEFVEIIVPIGERATISEMLQQNGVPLTQVRLHEAPTDRSWLRDSLPSVIFDSGSRKAMAWSFNAWAKYDNYLADQKLPELFSKASGIPALTPLRPDKTNRMVLEGGGIDVDGLGTVLVTREWLLSDVQVRNPDMTQVDYEKAFAEYLGAPKTIWLENGCAGDDTHGHIDDIARFVAPQTVILAYEEDKNDPNHQSSVENFEILSQASDATGRKISVVKVPYPRPVIFNGQRLPASYANFYIANSVVIVPTFNDERDREALSIIADLFPTRKVVGIHALDLVWGLGTLHCLTQQEPAQP